MPTERTSQSEANRNKEKLETGFQQDKRTTEFGKNNTDPNYDPSHVEGGIDPGKPSNPNVPTPRNMDQKDVPLHPAVVDTDKLKASGKSIHGLPNQPIVSVNPVSGKSGGYKASEPKQITDAQSHLLKNNTKDFPYDDEMEVGAGLFIAVEPNKTLDETILDLRKKVNRLNEYWSIPETDDEGAEVSDQVIVHELKRNDDGTIQLTDKNKPNTGANHTLRKRRIPIRLYAVQSVMQNDEEFSSDGALIVRVM